MSRSIMYALPVILFWSTGWICAAPVSGVDEVNPIESKAPNLFGEDKPSSGLIKTLSGQDKGQTVNVGAFGRIDLHIQNQDVLKVLQMLAIQSQRNIVSSAKVSGNISAALYDVEFHEALDAILHPNGYGYLPKGNFIYVYTAEELEEIKKRGRRLQTAVVRLNYLNATDAAKFLEAMMTTGVGSITVSGADPAGFDVSISSGGEKSYANVDILVIRDYPEVIEEMREVLKELDVRPQQVQIEATILEARLSEDNAFGIDLTILADFDMTDFANPLSAIDDMMTGAVGGAPSVRGQALRTTVGNTLAGSSGIKVGVVSSDVAAFVRALDQVTDTTVLANPTLQTLNRMPAKLISGEKLGYISTTATDTSSTQTVEFLEVGTQLAVRPFICEDAFIRLEVRPEISEGEVRAAEGFVIPNETTNELIANVIVPNGKTIVLGGLFKEDTTVTRKQVPWFGELPWLGSAFKGQDDIVRRAEVIFLIRPTIIKDKALVAAAERAVEDIEQAVMGSRQGLLPWSRTKLTASHLRDAHRFLSNGQKDRALWSINMALMLDATSVEAMRLKQDLTSQRLFRTDRGMIEQTIRSLIDQQLQQESAESALTPNISLPDLKVPDPGPAPSVVVAD